MKVAFGFDLHNTIMRSNEAWIEAMIACSDEGYRDYITQKVYNKYSRTKLAGEIGAEYDVVLDWYHKLVKPDQNMKTLLYILKEKFPLYLISASSSQKVYKDLTVWEGEKVFREILTKEQFDKKLVSDWESFLDDREIDILIYIGNDLEEDIINSERVISLLYGDFIGSLNKLDLLFRRGENI